MNSVPAEVCVTILGGVREVCVGIGVMILAARRYRVT